jgi:hypothetical protein
VRLYDGFGKKVADTYIGSTQGSIDVIGLANGVYQLLITDVVTQKTVTQSIIKL